MVFREQSYDLNLLSGALLWRDTRLIASLLILGKQDSEVRSLVLSENILQRASTKTALNILSYTRSRLASVPNEVISIIAGDDIIASKHACLLSAVSNSRFLQEFLRDVVCEKLETFNHHLTAGFWESFWASCVSNDPELQNSREKGQREIKGTILKILSEVAILDSVRHRELKKIRLEPQVVAVLNHPDLKRLQPCFRAFI